MITIFIILPVTVALCFSARILFLRQSDGQSTGKALAKAIVANLAFAVLVYGVLFLLLVQDFYHPAFGEKWMWNVQGALTWSFWSSLVWIPFLGALAVVNRREKN